MPSILCYIAGKNQFRAADPPLDQPDGLVSVWGVACDGSGNLGTSGLAIRVEAEETDTAATFKEVYRT
jgi:hypothetical protein